MTKERLNILLSAFKRPVTVDDAVALILGLKAVDCGINIHHTGLLNKRQLQIWDDKRAIPIKYLEEEPKYSRTFDLLEKAIKERSWEWGKVRTQKP